MQMPGGLREGKHDLQRGSEGINWTSCACCMSGKI